MLGAIYQPVRVRRLTLAGLSQFRIEPAGSLDGEWPVAAGIAAHAGAEHAFQRIGRVRRGVVKGAVQPALRLLRRRAGEIELDRVAGDRHLSADSAAWCRAGCSRSPSDTRRPAAPGSPSRIARLGAVLHHGGERPQVVHAVIGHERSSRSAPSWLAATKAWMSPSTSSGLRTFSREQGEQVLVRHAGAVEIHRRDLEALVVDLAGAQAVLGAADIADMADRARSAPPACRRGTPGVTTAMSNRWPAQSQGSLVTSTSPGTQRVAAEISAAAP